MKFVYEHYKSAIIGVIGIFYFLIKGINGFFTGKILISGRASANAVLESSFVYPFLFTIIGLFGVFVFVRSIYQYLKDSEKTGDFERE